jgi:26S proteasome regulatory subunit T1
MEYILTEILKNAFRATVEHHNRQQQQQQQQSGDNATTAHTPLPPVLITIVAPPHVPDLDKPATLSLRIRDQGGGVSSRHMARIFSYAFTTAGRRSVHSSSSSNDYFHTGDGDGDRGDGGGPYAAQHIGGSAAIDADIFSANGDGGGGGCGGGGGGGGVGLFGELTGMGVETGLGTIAGLGFGLPMSRLYAQYFGGSLDLYSLDGWGKCAKSILRVSTFFFSWG